MSLEQNGEIVKRLSHLLNTGAMTTPDLVDFADAFSNSQIASKNWLVETVNELNLNLGNVFLCGGWYATILLHANFKFSKLRNFDINPRCKMIADEIHRNFIIDDWRYLSITQDINEIDFSSCKFLVTRKNGTNCELTESPDTIINTSCEHIHNFKSWFDRLPKEKLIILQSNDGFEIEGHVNCSNSLADFSEVTPLSQTLYLGEKRMTKFTRFMKIGYK